MTSSAPNGPAALSSWRCVVKPRMVVRAAPSLEAPLHVAWPKGLLEGEQVRGRREGAWVRLARGGFGLIRHPERGLLLEELRSLPPEKASGATLERLQGRWRHSVAKMGLLTVVGKSVRFDQGMEFTLQELPDGSFDMGGWRSVGAKCTADLVTWGKEGGKEAAGSKGGGGSLHCTWTRLQKTPALFFGIVDVKFDPALPADEAVKALELGDGRASKFSHHGAAISKAFEEGYEMHPAPLRRAVLVDNKKLTHDAFLRAGAEKLRPRTGAYPRRYSPDLAPQLIRDLSLQDKDSAAVLKLCNRSRGAGVVVVTARTADSVLKSLLTPPAALEDWLRRNADKALQEGPEEFLREHCLYWWSNECPVFVAERCCHSLKVPLEGSGSELFDGTMRVAFALHGEAADRRLALDWLGGYWKLPAAAGSEGSEDPEALHGAVVSSFNSAEKRTAAVAPEHLEAVYAGLSGPLCAVFDRAGLAPEDLQGHYAEEAHFHAFALARSAASTRSADVGKARGLLQRALTMAEAAVGAGRELHDRSVLSYVERNLGVCCAMEGDWEAAFEKWKRSLELQPTNATARYLEGCYWQVSGDYEQGAARIQESLALDPDFRLAYLGLSECLLLFGDNLGALRACEACLRRFPEAHGARFNLGQAAYFRLLSLVPDGDVAERGIKALEAVEKSARELWGDHGRDMLAFLKAGDQQRQAMAPRDVWVSKVYGWRP